jgi:hypothetical protein
MFTIFADGETLVLSRDTWQPSADDEWLCEICGLWLPMDLGVPTPETIDIAVPRGQELTPVRTLVGRTAEGLRFLRTHLVTEPWQWNHDRTVVTIDARFSGDITYGAYVHGIVVGRI